jgi:hypothetical protein
MSEITYKDRFPLPRISDCLDALSGAVYFSTLDISSSFYNIEVEESSRDKLSFRTRKGQFRFRRMVQGGSNSPAVFFPVNVFGHAWVATPCVSMLFG